MTADIRYTLVAWVVALSTFAAPVHAQTLLNAQIDTGALAGVPSADPGVTVFKGVPFAAPPVGPLRWKPPVAPAKWTGVRAADKYGSSCMQKGHGEAGQAGDQAENSEDCLYLNVWTPAKSATEKLPVMVWLYGGAFHSGSSAAPGFEAVGLASKGAIVVVINYRLGMLGFLTSPELDAESPHKVSGNYGMLDQIESLKWVKRNIAAFGGDPKRVTIFGQSAGGGSVQFLAVMPQARGLFQRAIAQSGTMDSGDPLIWQGAMSYRTLKEAETNHWHYLRGIGIDSMAKLRALPAEQIIKLPPPQFPDYPPFFSPVLDGHVMPSSYKEAWARHKQADVPFMVGTAAEDLSGKPIFKTTLAAYRQWAQQKFAHMTDEFIRLYPASNDEEAGLAQNLAFHDQNRISKVGWANAYQKGVRSKLFIYFWNHPWPGQEARGAFHGSEIPYIMGSLPSVKQPWTDRDREISGMMTQYWANFAATGNPNGKGLVEWPVFTPAGTKTTMQLGDDSGAIEAATAARTDFFRRWFATRPQM
ncbi:MAG: carboxylesterase family protein [Pseudomonadota bacterium]